MRAHDLINPYEYDLYQEMSVQIRITKNTEQNFYHDFKGQFKQPLEKYLGLIDASIIYTELLVCFYGNTAIQSLQAIAHH